MLSSTTVGHAADIAIGAFNEGGLRLLFMKAGLGDHVVGEPYGKSAQVSTWIGRASRAARLEDDKAAKEGLHEFVRLVAEQVAPRRPEEGVEEGSSFSRLREVARSDGYDLLAETVGTSSHVRVRLLPLDHPVAPLSAEVTALEAELRARSLLVALNHYQQAVKNFVDQDFEAANAMLRAMFESIVVNAAASCGFQPTKQGDGGPAIAYLRDNGHLPERDGGDFVRGLWWVTHTNGPHPGTTTAGEVHFRMLTITGAARYLLDRFV